MLSLDMLAELAERSGLAEPSVVITDLGRSATEQSRTLALQATRPLHPASMIKVPIAAALCASWAAGKSHPTDCMAVNPANMTPNDGLSPLVPGYTATLEELSTLMLTRSDNVATNMLIDALGRDAITAYAQALGLTATYVRAKLSGALPLIDDPGRAGRNAHPASDSALLFEHIAQGSIAGAAWLEKTLHAQEWNEKLASGLQPGDRFAHKTGDTDEGTHDGGILFTPQKRRYVLVVYTALPSSPQGDARLQAFMRELRPLL